MFITSWNFPKLMKSKVTITVFTIIVIVLICTSIFYTICVKTELLNGTPIKNIVNKFENNNIFNMNSFYAEYEATIVSNKNQNSYNIKEWYKNDMGTKFEFIDSSGSSINIMFYNNKMLIQNIDQKNEMYIDPYITNATNLISIHTFLEIYNKSTKENCCFTALNYEKAHYITMILENICKKKNCKCDYKEAFRNISKLELKVNKKTKLPITYIVYNNDKKEIISIVYNKFNINAEINKAIFDI
ncbi:MAG: hypothetical protein PHR25_05315 [Clostridia bacterium]|nr:hypothetical protein [Clostridia bacterium]MDD4376184.1 hypothetical protein [Clostridia bacterium]